MLEVCPMTLREANAYACTLLALFSLLWKMESIERRLKRLYELLEGEGDDGEG